MPAGYGNTRIVGNRCYTLVSIPVSVLHGFDDDRNGLMSPSELGAHGKEIEAQLDARVLFFDDTARGKTIYQSLLVEHTDSATTNMSSITLMRISEFKQPIKKLRVRLDLFPAQPAADSLIVFNAIRDKNTETRRFSAMRTENEFFAAGQFAPWILAGLLAVGALLVVKLRVLSKPQTSSVELGALEL